MTTKVHQCHDHVLQYMDTTGESLYCADCSYTESSHGRLRRLEETHNLKTVSNVGSERHIQKNTSGVVRFAFRNLGEGNLSMPDHVYSPGGDGEEEDRAMMGDGESPVWAAGDSPLGKRKRDEEEFHPPKAKRIDETKNNVLAEVDKMDIGREEEFGTDGDGGTEMQHSVAGKIPFVFTQRYLILNMYFTD